MALVLGTNSGFVTEAPTEDPTGAGETIDGHAIVTKDTSPATATRITEIGWYSTSVDEDENFEVGLYAADGADGIAGTLLYVSRTNPTGTTSGWKSVSVDWAISGNTAYWLGFQLDDTATNTYIDYAISGGQGYDTKEPTQTTLTDPFGGGALRDSDAMYAIYAVWEAYTPPTGTNQYINIGDQFKQISEAYINIGDSWKRIGNTYINIGDEWKKLF